MDERARSAGNNDEKRTHAGAYLAELIKSTFLFRRNVRPHTDTDTHRQRLITTLSMHVFNVCMWQSRIPTVIRQDTTCLALMTKQQSVITRKLIYTSVVVIHVIAIITRMRIRIITIKRPSIRCLHYYRI